MNEDNTAGQPHSELRNIIEAAIMISSDPLTIDRMLAMFPDDAQPDRDVIRSVISEIEQSFVDRGIELRQIGKGYRLQTREDYSPWLSRLSAARPQRYSRALLETLAIIAYRQPVTRGEIEDVRGVAVSTEIIRTLQDRDWIRQVGVRDVPGKPGLFGTTRGFLEYFNLKSLSDLPPLTDIRDMETIAAELNLSLPLDPPQDGEVDAQDDAGEEGADLAGVPLTVSDQTSVADLAAEEEAAGETLEALYESVPDEDVELNIDEPDAGGEQDPDQPA
jgi:segregation and condensation protein B